VKNGGNHKKPEKKGGEKGQEKGNCERPYLSAKQEKGQKEA
jgi:hypothetical protein